MGSPSLSAAKAWANSWMATASTRKVMERAVPSKKINIDSILVHLVP